MTFSEQMLLVATRAGMLMGPELRRATAFVQAQLNADGGFAGRDGRSDIYYTAFALDVLAAGGADVPREATASFVRSIDGVDALDLVHIACLARCWERLAPVTGAMPANVCTAAAARLAQHRTPTGGFSTVAGSPTPSVTGTFLALLAHSDLGVELADATAAVNSLRALRTADGAYANDPGLAAGTVLATAGVQIVRHWLGLAPEPEITAWLARHHRPDGGFPASPASPVADLLSTATALFALRLPGGQLPREIVTGCTEFVDGMMEENGGFGGHWLDETPDCEYTYYALLVYGCLAG